MSDARLTAVGWLTQIIKDHVSLNQITASPAEGLTPQDKALAKQLLFGTLRFYHQLATILNNLLAKPLKSKDTDVQVVLLLGLYQLKYLATPDHAAISESVELAKKIRKKWAASLVNGVLRQFQREQTTLAKQLQKSVQFQFSHPGWIVSQVRADWPAQADEILQHNNQHAPMVLRVNTHKLSRETYLAQLASHDIAAKAHPIAPDAISLNQPMDVFQLPGFNSGDVTIQDAAPQLVVEMMQLDQDYKVLDGCAAPGGKTTHLLQRRPTIQLTAVELSAARAIKIEQTLERLKFQCDIKIADILDTTNWWDKQPFDRILLDVPCSASGVIRRNPDIKIHRLKSDLTALVALQKSILNAAWQWLKPGGILVYATCSIFKAENQQQIEQFLLNNQAEVMTLPKSIETKLNQHASIGYQILPGDWEMDGFYFCALKKPT